MGFSGIFLNTRKKNTKKGFKIIILNQVFNFKRYLSIESLHAFFDDLYDFFLGIRIFEFEFYLMDWIILGQLNIFYQQG